MDNQDKNDCYARLYRDIGHVLKGEQDRVAVMSTLAAMINDALDPIFWIGFYINNGDGLIIGPYQGPLACLYIPYDKGVCGRAYRSVTTQIVNDVHLDPEHISCNPGARSEIVVPVKNRDGSVFGVLDVDSDRVSAFNHVDAGFLEAVVTEYLTKSCL